MQEQYGVILMRCEQTHRVSSMPKPKPRPEPDFDSQLGTTHTIKYYLYNDEQKMRIRFPLPASLVFY